MWWRKGRIKFGEISIGEDNIQRSTILAYVVRLARFRNYNNPLAEQPRQSDLRRRSVVPGRNAL